MAKWQRELDLTDIWQKATDREITPKQFVEILRDRLKAVNDFGLTHGDAGEYANMKKEDLLVELDSIIDEDGLDWDDLDNYILTPLYNWGDISLDGQFAGKKVCWIRK